MPKVARRLSKEIGNWTLSCDKNYELMEVTVFSKLEQVYNNKGCFYNSFYKKSDLNFPWHLIRNVHVCAGMS